MWGRPKRTPESARDPRVQAAQRAERLLAQVDRELDRSDQKASMLLTALGVGVSLVLASLLAGDVDLAGMTSSQAGVWVTGGVFAIASVACAALALWPHGGVRRSAATGWSGRSVDIANDADTLVVALKRDPDAEIEALAHDIVEAARRVRFVYRSMRMSIVFAFIAGIALAVVAFRLV